MVGLASGSIVDALPRVQSSRCGTHLEIRCYLLNEICQPRGGSSDRWSNSFIIRFCMHTTNAQSKCIWYIKRIQKFTWHAKCILFSFTDRMQNVSDGMKMREEEWMFHIGAHALVAGPFRNTAECVRVVIIVNAAAPNVCDSETNMRWSTAKCISLGSIDKCALKRCSIEIKAIRKIMFSFLTSAVAIFNLYSVFRRSACVCWVQSIFFPRCGPASSYSLWLSWTIRFSFECSYGRPADGSRCVAILTLVHRAPFDMPKKGNHRIVAIRYSRTLTEFDAIEFAHFLSAQRISAVSECRKFYDIELVCNFASCFAAHKSEVTLHNWLGRARTEWNTF